MLIIVAATALASLPGRNQKDLQANENKLTQSANKSDSYPGPIVDYDAEQITGPVKPTDHTLRQIRSNRYNGRAPQPFGELPPDMRGFGISSDLTTLLPALPVKQSDAIVLGEVIDAKAYLSTDKTGVYSEFAIRIDDVLMDFTSSPIPFGTQIILEREGGVVRFSSGRLFQYAIYNQGLPRNGQRYVFFLKNNEQGRIYSILTGYCLRKGRVSPLDKPEQFTAYEGADETVFIHEIREAITNRASSN
jgi:hypothetical protein